MCIILWTYFCQKKYIFEKNSVWPKISPKRSRQIWRSWKEGGAYKNWGNKTKATLSPYSRTKWLRRLTSANFGKKPTVFYLFRIQPYDVEFHRPNFPRNALGGERPPTRNEGHAWQFAWQFEKLELETQRLSLSTRCTVGRKCSKIDAFSPR